MNLEYFAIDSQVPLAYLLISAGVLFNNLFIVHLIFLFFFRNVVGLPSEFIANCDDILISFSSKKNILPSTH